MAKELNEDTSFKVSIKTLAGIAALIFTLVSMTRSALWRRFFRKRKA